MTGEVADAIDRIRASSDPTYARTRRVDWGIRAAVGAAHRAEVVYFVGAPECQLIKIGYAKNADKRLVGLQTGSPVVLMLLRTVPCSRQTERLFHDLFSRHRAHGEWFKRSPGIEAVINATFVDDFDHLARLAKRAEARR